MDAVHWVRTRQEERELTYWLSIVSYDHRDHSFNNRIYLLYLIVFFSVWIFITLTFLASGGAVFLRLLNPEDPARAAIFLEVLLLGVWSVFALWQSVKRSPVVFSEQDATLICQMPLSHRQVTMRWFFMPWLKSAIPFWLVAITIGFSLAEIAMPGTMGASRLPEYAGYGIRAWIAILPVQLALFSLQWIVGVYRLQKDLERRWLVWPVLTTAIVFLAFLLFFTFGASVPFSLPWNSIAEAILFPLQSGFGHGDLFVSLLSSGLFAVVLLGILFWISDTFSLSRAAQETQEMEVLNSALRFGFTSYAENLQTQQRLGMSRAPSRLPVSAGAGMLIWKDILQSQRSFRLSALSTWFIIFGIMSGLSLLPDLSSRAVAIAVWVIMIGKVSVIRIRSDLSCWSLVRQLPIAHKKFLLFELGSAYLLSVIISLTGLAVSSIISRTPIDGLAALVPGIIAGVAGMAIFDVTRRSRSSLLLNGVVPQVGAGGILLGLIFAAVPIFIDTFLSGMIGLFLAFSSSLLLGIIAFNLAVHFYHNIDLS